MATIKYRTSSTAPWITLTNVDSTQPSDALPLMDGVANAGTSDAYARGDHKHPSDTSRANTSLSNLSDNNEALKNLGAKSNPNLLDNPWFTINQRGATTWTQYGYGVDRWMTTGSATQTALDGIQVDESIFQKVENLNALVGKTLTMSVMLADGTIYSGTSVLQNLESGVSFFNAESVSTMGFFSSYWQAFQIATNQKIRAVKLEYGSVSTLANDLPPDPVAELLKCKRYFRRDRLRMVVRTVSNLWTTPAFDVPMRTRPSLVNASLMFHPYGQVDEQISISEASVIEQGLHYFRFNCNATAASGNLANVDFTADL